MPNEDISGLQKSSEGRNITDKMRAMGETHIEDYWTLKIRNLKVYALNSEIN